MNTKESSKVGGGAAEMSFPRIQKYRKGDVFFVNEEPWMTNEKIQKSSHIIAKSRPYAIITGDEVLMKNPQTIQMLPLTSQYDSKNCGDDILIMTPNGVNRIVTSQILTIDIRDLRNYMYHLPDSVILDIDLKISKRLGLVEVIAKMAKEVESVENGLRVAKESAAKFVENCRFDLTRKGKEIEQTKVIHNNDTKEQTKEEHVEENKEKKSADFIQRQRGKYWTSSLIAQFLNEYRNKTYSTEELAKRYSIKVSTVYSTYYNFRHR